MSNLFQYFNKYLLPIKIVKIMTQHPDSLVALVYCDSYDTALVREQVRKGVDLLGGIDQFVKPGEHILLKPNLLIGDPPEKCATTHPSVFHAIAELLLSAGAVVSYGDSPGFGSPSSVAKKAGLADVADKLKIPLADFVEGDDVFFEKGIQNKKFVIAKGVLAADGIISLPKLKTHGLQKFTGCIKNQFGCIPGLLKPEFHVKLPDAIQFAQMLVDLNQCVHPRLYIMDGIWAMEGNGPRGGIPKQMNILLMSADPIALDATVCRMFNLDPALVPTIKLGAEAGAGTFLAKDIKLLGDAFKRFQVPNFQIDRGPIKPFSPSTGKWKLLEFFNNGLVPKPVINSKRCIRCGLCLSVCPAKPKALNWKNALKKSPPQYQYSHCIRCYCCQEMCPEKAITLKKPFLRKLLRF